MPSKIVRIVKGQHIYLFNTYDEYMQFVSSARTRLSLTGKFLDKATDIVALATRNIILELEIDGEFAYKKHSVLREIASVRLYKCPDSLTTQYHDYIMWAVYLG